MSSVRRKMTDLADVYAFLENEAGVREAKLTPYSDLESDLGITGDDFFELAEAFAKAFNVDMAAYRWYFHHSEEGTFNPGALFFKPPYRRVARIPVTPALLLSAAHAGAWPVSYPEHFLSRRYDILLTYVILAIGGISLALLVSRGRGGV
jgi:hypothetical protein